MSTRTGIALTLVVLALLAPAHAKNAEGASSRRWVIVVDGGHRAGEQVVDCRGDGHCSARYVFKDNGRGPEIAERSARASTNVTRCRGASGAGAPPPNVASPSVLGAVSTCR
jgi:hypothetical protein